MVSTYTEVVLMKRRNKMKLDFTVLQQALLAHFDTMTDGELFYVELPERNTLVDVYLGSFPEGTDPIYRERTVHDCNCCRSFLRQFGNIVKIKEDGTIVSLWDFKVEDPNYQVVVDALSKEIHKHPITNVFRADKVRCGTELNHELTDEGKTIQHDHFFLDMPERYVMSEDRYSSYKGERLADHQVLSRSLVEINKDAVDIVLDIIDQGSLYRGEEHKHTVQMLKRMLQELEDKNLDVVSFSWLKSAEIGSAGRIRNTVIGTLLVDISEGKDLEHAVKSYEDKVAPHNYKRSKALVTQKMIDKAQATINELGINASFARRFAKASDLNINNVLFADSKVQSVMEGGVFDAVKPSKREAKKINLDKVEEVTINDFLSKILPKADAIEVMVTNKHKNNFVSVIAPEDISAPKLFKWGNPFSWSYNGEVTDSMKEHVKAAGGSVTGDLRFSIKWNDEDSCSSDLDAHCHTPLHHIYFARSEDGKGGELDVDITQPRGVAVENITFESRSRMVEGDYKFSVNNFSKRSGRSSFTAQIEFDGVIHDYTYDKDLSGTVDVATVSLRNGQFSIKQENLKSSQTSQEVWGVNTLEWTPVEMIMNSPNHWDGEETGNKHYFFILRNCINPDDARGFYNEFLRPELNEHRKSFEVLSSKLKAKTCNEQLSGVGFSSTQRNELLVKVSGSFNRVIKVKF